MGRPWEAAVTLLASLVVAAALPAQDLDSFERERGKIHRLMSRGQWAAADQRLDQLLIDHAGQDYALSIAAELADDLKQCRFHSANPTPKPEELVRGQISWNQRSRKLRLLYEPGSFGDFQRAEGLQFLIHPVCFDGSYTITVEGNRFSITKTDIQLLLSASGDTAYVAEFGFLTRLIRISAGSAEVLATGKRHDAENGEPFSLSARVTAGQIQVQVNGKTTLRHSRRKGEGWGQFGYRGNGIARLKVEGKAEPSWLQGLVDARLQRTRAEFDKRWEQQPDLPAWLATAIATPPESEPSKGTEYPGELSDDQRLWLARSETLFERGHYGNVLNRSLNASDREAPAWARAFLDAKAEIALGRGQAALDSLELAGAQNPDFWQLHTLRAEALILLQRWDEAADLLRQAIDASPREGGLYHELALMLLSRDRLDEAEQLLAEARAAKAVDTDLRALDTMLRMARRGPAWPKIYQYKSKHYLVSSDIDRDTCIDAARILEQAYVMYQSQLSWVREPDRPKRFRVFLFSGQSGYQDYCGKILGSAPSHTAGLYSPTLKQLLIWNLPDREQMMQTVRHEGFHQYLDRVVADPPIWLNEGLAEYYEHARFTNGRMSGGQIQTEHLWALDRPTAQLRPLAEFVRIDRGDFYSDMTTNYAQGWALVHFLRDGPKENRKHFRKLFEELQAEADHGTAIDAAFAGVDWRTLEQEYRDHLEQLRERSR